jgi:hypothetical protein
LAARKTILVITGSIKYPVALSRSIKSSNDSNIELPPQPTNFRGYFHNLVFAGRLAQIEIDANPKNGD